MAHVLLALAALPFQLIPPNLPPKAAAPLYFPTTVGTRWVYQTGDRERVEAITAVTQKAGARIVVVGFPTRGGFEPIHALAVSHQGIALVEANVAGFDEPFWMLKQPVPRGNQWDAVIAITGVGKWTGTMTASEPEWVEVPAGKFRATRVQLDIVFTGERRRITTWYAPGVGRVKEVNGDSVEVLKSFTVGKK